MLYINCRQCLYVAAAIRRATLPDQARQLAQSIPLYFSGPVAARLKKRLLAAAETCQLEDRFCQEMQRLGIWLEACARDFAVANGQQSPLFLA